MPFSIQTLLPLLLKTPPAAIMTDDVTPVVAVFIVLPCALTTPVAAMLIPVAGPPPTPVVWMVEFNKFIMPPTLTPMAEFTADKTGCTDCLYSAIHDFSRRTCAD